MIYSFFPQISPWVSFFITSTWAHIGHWWAVWYNLPNRKKIYVFLNTFTRLGINILTSELVCLVGADDDWPGSCVWPNTPDWSKPISLNPSNENLWTKWRGWTKKVIDQLSFTFFTKVPIGCIVIIKDLAITDIISTYYLFKDIVLQYVVKNKIYCFLVFLRMSWTKDDAYWWNIL